MKLSKDKIAQLQGTVQPVVPDPAIFSLPEKVMQFGTGVLLRGLPDYFIDKANRQGIFNGRVVVVKSTANGNTAPFDAQDGLYTLAVRGIAGGEKIEENIISSAISRVLTAQTEWEAVLKVAASPDLQIITSNTTETGIVYTKDDLFASPPASFPGKVLAVLYHRYHTFKGDPEKGLVIVPAELISDNGSLLRSVVLQLANAHKLAAGFVDWLTNSNTFCNTLVDRIVPGKPDEATLKQLAAQLGYEDDLLLIAEVYRLWAIEGDEKVKEILSFEQADAGLVITNNITVFKELKLRLLNGTHTLSCAVAFLAGADTVAAAMGDTQITRYITSLMQDDIANAIPYPVSDEVALDFAEQVLDRFRNPHIAHLWLSISTNYTLKLKARVLPVLKQYYENFNAVPEYIALGFAAYLQFFHVTKLDDAFYGNFRDKAYQVDDAYAGYFETLWRTTPVQEIAYKVLADTNMWEENLSLLPGFAASVTEYLQIIQAFGIQEAIEISLTKRISVE